MTRKFLIFLATLLVWFNISNTIIITKLEKQLNDVKRQTEQLRRETRKFYVEGISLDQNLQQFTYLVCQKYGVDYKTVLALMKVESGYNWQAIGYNSNGTRDVGLMQVNTMNKRWLQQHLGVTNLHNPYQNIQAGVYLYATLYHKYKDEHKALTAYNRGERGMKRLASRGFRSRYSREVLTAKAGLQ